MKKIAIFHNFMDNIGGAEILSLTLARELKADIYSTNVDIEKIAKMGFADVTVKSIGHVPVNAPFKQQFSLWRFRHLNLRDQYDFFIISGDWAMAGAVNNYPNLWYVHSPIREIWDLYEYTRKNTVPVWARPIFDLWVKLNRYYNRKYIKRVDLIACNSQNTKNRLTKYLNREATIINPPIETKDYYGKPNGNFWLSVNRLIGHKRVDLQMKAFSALPNEKLILVGSYEQSRHFQQYADYIKRIQPANVEIKSWVSRQELLDLYANCRGFITTAQDEDFGMTVVEAMAAGKPVIAPNEGGYKESVIDGETGKLIDNIDSNKLIEAIKKIGPQAENYQAACLKQAQKFDTQVFIAKIKALIGTLANNPAK
ncbi:MAG: glycosyltransferase [Candidatus Paceibacterota bacterium]|jgi:glycosyltransferase involved in cell wall biosynthesis